MACSKGKRSSELLKGLSLANASFCRSLFQTVSKTNSDENLFMSSYSILSVLAIALLGARDRTASELLTTLSLSKISQELPEILSEYMSLLSSSSGGCVLSMANKLFVRRDKKLCKEFLEKCQLMKAKAELCDFAGNAEAECSRINSWVSKETHEKIQNVVSPLLLSKDTSILVVNAIYFKGAWMNMFSPGSTYSEQFTVSNSQVVNVDMMHLTDTFGYRKLDDLKCNALELPYKDNHLSMVIFLPFANDGLDFVLQHLTVSHLTNTEYSKSEVNVSIPRFKMEGEFELSDVLISMGIKTAFNPLSANFRGIDPQGLLTLSKVIHKSFVEVNEYGTEAAACTSMDCVDGMLMPPPISFKADHPFLFFIRDNKTDMILFIGKLINPEGLGTSQPQSDWLMDM